MDTIKKISEISLKIVFFLLSSLLIAFPALGDSGIRFIETKGRSVVIDDAELSKARRLALEDAIFLAAMHGGAQIDGFSSVDMQTTISDHFTLRPTGKILDFDILKEELVNDHYEISIKAAVGEVGAHQCSLRDTSTITIFNPIYNFSPDTPAWLQQLGQKVARISSTFLQNYSDFKVTNVAPIALNIDDLKSTDDEFDYLALTRGSIRVPNGDFAYTPEVEISINSVKKGLEKNTYLKLALISKLYNGRSYTLAASEELKSLIKLQGRTPWRTLDILANPSRKEIERSINSGIERHVDALIKKLKCIPLTAMLNLEDGKLTVDLGNNHGITANNLAVSNGTNTPYTILKVKETFSNRSVLEPLNRTTDLSALVGKKVDFMEPSL